MGLSSSPISCGSGLSCMIAALAEADNGVDIGDVVVVDTLVHDGADCLLSASLIFDDCSDCITFMIVA